METTAIFFTPYSNWQVIICLVYVQNETIFQYRHIEQELLNIEKS